MNKVVKIVSLSALMLGLIMNFSQAESFWDKTKNAVIDTVDKVSETATDLVEDDKTSLSQQKHEIDVNAEKALSRLFQLSIEAKVLYEKSAGYAVFDSREFAFLIKTGFGSGVAVNKVTRSRTYMKMASAGLNVGGGVKYVKVIFIFPTEQTLNHFISNGWNAEGDASAVGGDDSAQLGITLADGTKVYELVETGIMLKMSISGTKYWPDSDLN